MLAYTMRSANLTIMAAGRYFLAHSVLGGEG